MPYRNGRTYEDYLGLHGLKRLGLKKWRHAVADVVERPKTALEADYVVIGGGNAKLLKKLPPGARLGNNANAFLGGFRLWEGPKPGRRPWTQRMIETTRRVYAGKKSVPPKISKPDAFPGADPSACTFTKVATYRKIYRISLP